MSTILNRLPFKEARWFKFILFVLKRFEEDNCRERAGSLTYTTMLSLVPMLTVFLVILSSIPALQPARAQLQNMVYSNLLPASSGQVTEYLNSFAEKSTNLTAIGIIFLFVTTVMLLSTIEQAFNRVWRVSSHRGGVAGFMRYWTMISLGPILLGSAFALSSTLTSINLLNQNVAGYAIDWGIWLKITSVGMTLAGFTFLYWLIPNCKVPLKSAAIAGVSVGLLFELLKTSFGFAIGNFTSYDQVYGAFAILPVFLLWIYLSWNLILLGVEISYAINVFTTDDHQPRHPVLALLSVLKLFYDRQKIGATVQDAEAMQVLGREEVEDWTKFAQILQRDGLICKTEDDDYVLCRNLDEIDFWTFYQSLPYALPRRADMGKVEPDDLWIQVIGPALIQSDDYLSAKLSIPLSKILDVQTPAPHTN
ncbi:MAG: YihY family inner membrane protein [Pseudomonadota bacterium]|nr:YihY family inner membrane protein [Pseudomonadota bacterium]